MIRFGLRLAVASGREALTRLVIIAVAVAIGVGLLLGTLAAVNAVNTQNARYAWLNTSATTNQAGASAADPLWWAVRADYYDGQTIGRVDLAATGQTSPVPPGIPRLPGPGEFYASPAMTELLSSVPPDQLGDRYPGHQIGTIGSAALPSADSLIIITGHSPSEMSDLPGASQVTSIASLTPGKCHGCDIGLRSAGIELMLSVVVAALLFPVLIFIGAATRLAAARREQRFAAMRLIGATPRQISVVSAVESTAAAVAGTALGFGLFFLLRHPISEINFTGARFYPTDLTLNLADILSVLVGIPLGAVVAARLALRRVRISPLGVIRRVTPKPPRAHRLLPVAVGIAELAYFDGRRPITSIGQVAAFLPGFLLIMAGLVIAGPWFTMVGSRVLARRSSRPATLIAARRLADNPSVAFRAISGLVLGLFVTTVATAVITTIVDHRGAQRTGVSHTLLSKDLPPSGAASVPNATLAQLRSTPGVSTVIVMHANPDHSVAALPGLVACSDLASHPDLGRCADGASVVQVWPDFGASDPRGTSAVWSAAPVSPETLARLPAMNLSVDTDGSRSTIERVRTLIERTFPRDRWPPATQDDFRSDSTKELAGWQQLANVVILASLPIAGCSLAVSIAGGLTERKRPFALLRLTGVRLHTLRRVVAMESAVPLLAVAIVAIGAGLLGADLFLRAQMHYTLDPLGPEYYVVVLAGLIAALSIIAAALPLLERITGPETARNE